MEFQLLEFSGCLASAMLIAVMMLGLTDDFLCKVGQWKFLTPSWISIWHAPLAWTGYILFIFGHWFIGFNIVVFAAILDRLDGRVARILDSRLGLTKPVAFWPAVFHPGGSDWGKHIDAGTDKAAILPIYSHILYLGDLDVMLFSALVFTEAVGTIMRFRIFKRFTNDDAAATWAGKTKCLLQWLFLIVYAPVRQGWIPEEYGEEYGQLMYRGFTVVLVFAVLSVLTKIKWGAWWTALNHALTKFFSHRSDR